MLFKQSRMIALSTVFAALFSSAAHAQDEIKVGFMPPLTGTEAPESKFQTEVVNLAVKQVNATGGIRGKKLKVVTEDNQSNPQGSLAAYEKLIDQHKVNFVIAGYKSAQLVAMLPKMEKSNVPTFIGGTFPRLTESGRWFFRCRPNDIVSAEVAIRYIKENTNFKKIGIIHDMGAFGVGGANLVEKQAKDHGLNVVKRAGFPIGETNFVGKLDEIKAAGAEAVIAYVANQPDGGNLILEHARIGKPFFFLVSPSAQSKVALNIAKEAADGMHAFVDFTFGERAEDKKFVEDFKAEYKEMPDTQASYMYDAIMMYATAARAVGTDPEKVREYIHKKLKGYKGVMGTYNFTEKGDSLNAMSVIKIDGGNRKLIKVVNLSDKK